MTALTLYWKLEMCIWSGVSRSRLCQTSFLPFVSFPSLFIPERFTLVEATWCLEAIHPGKWECTLISVMRRGYREMKYCVFSYFVVLWSRPGVGLDVLMLFVFWGPVVTVLGVVVVPCCFSYRHLYHVVTWFPVVVPTWYTSGFEIISCGALI